MNKSHQHSWKSDILEWAFMWSSTAYVCVCEKNARKCVCERGSWDEVVFYIHLYVLGHKFVFCLWTICFKNKKSHSRKSTSIFNLMSDGWIPFTCSSFKVQVLCVLAHCRTIMAYWDTWIEWSLCFSTVRSQTLWLKRHFLNIFFIINCKWGGLFVLINNIS